MSATAAAIEQVRDGFEQLWHGQPEGIWLPPGRINLIGEHTDYNGGYVLPFALAQGATAAARRRTDSRIRVHSLDLTATVETTVAQVVPGAELGWAAYVAGVGWAAGQRGLAVPGIELVLSSSVPVGAGLSSSAALSCVAAKAWSDLAGWDLSPEELAGLGRDAENQIAGAPTGVMDQLASTCGRAGHALKINTGTIQIEPIPFDPKASGLNLLVIDSNTEHTHADGEYGERRASCSEAASRLGVDELCDIPIDGLAQRLAGLPELLRRRARHVITDSARVLQVSQLLASGADPRETGPLLNASHDSMRDDFEITVPTVDLIQQTALAAGAYGARMTGGGFGGCVIALVDADRCDAVLQRCVEAAAAAGFPAPTGFAAEVGEGSRRIR